jgi:hypothetical protein
LASERKKGKEGEKGSHLFPNFYPNERKIDASPPPGEVAQAQTLMLVQRASTTVAAAGDPEMSQEEFLDWLVELLGSGPIIIGETHDQAPARLCVQALIERGAVKYLSLENPIVPQNLSRDDGQLTDQEAYYKNLKSYANEVTMQQLTAQAQSTGSRVYCHDMPLYTSPLNTAANPDDLTEYRTYATQFLPNTVAELPRLESATWKKHMVAARNQYACNYLRAKVGNGFRVLHGLVILAGKDHVIAKECNGANTTLQACLGISPERVFIIVDDGVSIFDNGVVAPLDLEET